jgi:putative DNA primase/helicase
MTDEYTVDGNIVTWQDDEPEVLPPLDWLTCGVPMSDKSVPDEAREYLKARGWTAERIERAKLRYVTGKFIAERWRRSTVRDALTAQASKVKVKKGAPATKPDRYRPTGGIVLPMAADYGVIRVFYHVEHGEPRSKYVMPGREPARVHVPHHMRGIKALGAKRAPLVIVEGYLKAELAASYDIPCLGINGCSGWRVTKVAGLQAAINGDAEFEPATRPEILKHWQPGRAGILQVDGDYETNLNVRAALLSFIDIAITSGRVPLVRPLPENMGLDDWIATGHIKADYDALPTFDAESSFVRKLRAPFYDCNQTGLADRFVAYHGDNTFHDPIADQWYSHVDGAGWREGLTVPNERMQEVMRSLTLEITAEKNPGMRARRAKFKDDCAQNGAQNGALSQAIRTGKIKIDAALFDANSNLLGVRNGILRLSDGELLPPSRDLMVTKLAGCAFDPKGSAPGFVSYMRTVTNGDLALLRYLQEVVGAALLGRAIRTAIQIFYGPGGTGKTTLIEIILALLGQYATATKADLLLRQRRHADPEAPTPFLKVLRGLRLVVCSELNENVALDEALIKDLSGADTVTARGLHEAPVTFKNTAAIWIRGNHAPVINGTDTAIRERVNIVPFDHVIEAGTRDKTLAERIIATELPGVLNWALIGMRRYVERGYEFVLPEAVSKATEQVQIASDVIGAWLDDSFEVNAKQTELPWRATQTDVTRSYRDWCAQNGHRAMSSKMLWAKLRLRFGFGDDWPLKSDGGKFATGFKAIPADPSAQKMAETFVESMVDANKDLAELVNELRRENAALKAARKPSAASDSSDSSRGKVISIVGRNQ